MTTCKQLEESYTYYVCDLLNDEQMALIEEHLRDCSPCAREIEALKEVLSLTEEAGVISVPDGIIDDLEMKVYRRLAVESPQSTPIRLFSRLFGAFSSRPAWFWRFTVTTCILAIGIPIAAIFFNQNRPADVSFQVASPHERVKQYRQQQMQLHLDDALVTMYLKHDDWAAAGEFRKLKEQARGTALGIIEIGQLQSARLASKGGI